MEGISHQELKDVLICQRLLGVSLNTAHAIHVFAYPWHKRQVKQWNFQDVEHPG